MKCSALEDRLWEQAEPNLYISKDEFLKSLEGWTIKPVEIGGVLALITLQKGAHFHFRSLHTGKRISMRIVRDCLQPIIDEFGYAETRTPKEDLRQHRFNQLIGFGAVGEDEFDTHFRIEKLPHA